MDDPYLRVADKKPSRGGPSFYWDEYLLIIHAKIAGDLEAISGPVAVSS
ncbi:hypothetical protein [Arthrobacter sp. efr-133-TYG-118]|nr:hypothetical protein [Arthrobacter sp. efr-133-TYG-118]